MSAATTSQARIGSHLPVNLLKELDSCDSESPSTSHRAITEDQATVDCELNFKESDTHMCKAAIQISKAIGENSLLQEFNKIRLQLKQNACEGKRPSTEEKTHYNIILQAKLYTLLVSTKQQATRRN